uniref:Non-specific serine/threonine protein kinase n=1 Tax=Heterorhabditis bacteriophora TaxID=37862 RepID=A0A1I7XVJ0_HETBA
MHRHLQLMAFERPGDEVRRLSIELEKQKERQVEIIAQEEEKRKQLVEHYQGQLAELQTLFNEKDCELKNLQERIEEERTHWVLSKEQHTKGVEMLVRRITGDFESLKMQNGSTGNTPLNGRYGNIATPASGWGSRRMNKAAKMEVLDAQKALKAEIRAKCELQEELTKTRSAFYNSKARLEEAEDRLLSLHKEIETLKLERDAASVHQARGNVEEMDGRTFFNMVPEANASTPRESYQSSCTTDYEISNSSRRLCATSSTGSPPAYENTVRHGQTPSTASTMLIGNRGGSPKVIQSLNNALKGRGHQFHHVHLNSPTKCGQCTSILVGLDRQGLYCQTCQYACHVHCSSRVIQQCPVPPDARRPLGIDPFKGVGTAYEGLVKTPRSGGVKKVLDMRDPDFGVTGVSEQDVIHAQKNDLAKIFRITTSQIQGVSPSDDGTVTRQYTLLMADTQEERKKWVIALNELKTLLKRSRLADRSAFVVKEVFDVASLPSIRVAQCAAIIDRTKIVVGFADNGLYCVELDRETLVAVGGEKENNRRCVEKVEYNAAEQLLMVMIGPQKDRHIRLVPSAALDGRDLKWIKVSDTKGCHMMAMGPGPSGSNMHFIAVAIKKSVIVYQIDRSERRHRKWKELAMPGFPQALSIESGRLVVGFTHSFRSWSLSDQNNTKHISLVNMEDQSLQFLSQANYEAQLMIEVMNETSNSKEYLLAFNKIGLYVDEQGRRSRSQELMFPSVPRPGGFAHLAPNLCVYSENQIDVFNVLSAEWIQTITLRVGVPLTRDGLLTLCLVNDYPYVVMLSDVLSDEDSIALPSALSNISSTSFGKRNKGKRKFLVRTHGKDEPRVGDRRSNLPISGPSDFMHIVHMGPGSVHELQSFIDLQPQNQSSNDRVLGLLPIMRSTSSSSTTVASVKQLGGSKHDIEQLHRSRPLSTTSKSSEGSSLGRDGNTTTSSASVENPYLEPMSKLGVSNSSALQPVVNLSTLTQAPTSPLNKNYL